MNLMLRGEKVDRIVGLEWVLMITCQNHSTRASYLPVFAQNYDATQRILHQKMLEGAIEHHLGKPVTLGYIPEQTNWYGVNIRMAEHKLFLTFV